MAKGAKDVGPGPIKSPKQIESEDGVLKKDSDTLPSGAARPPKPPH